MKIKLKDTKGITLKTKDKLCTEDIEIIVDRKLIPKDTINITSNGKYDVANYASANVKINDMLQTRINITHSCAYLFYKYENSQINFISNLDTSKVTNMENMFESCYDITTIPPIDTSKVTNMPRMFYNCHSLTTIPPIDTSNVTSMNYMFYYCHSLTTIPRLDTTKVTDMRGIFYNCFRLKKIDITHYNTSSVSYNETWCNKCYSLKAIIIRSFSSTLSLDSSAFADCYHLTGTKNSTYNPTGAKDGYIYVPSKDIDLIKEYGWKDYASQIRVLEDYTVDGTTTGEFDDVKAGYNND